MTGVRRAGEDVGFAPPGGPRPGGPDGALDPPGGPRFGPDGPLEGGPPEELVQTFSTLFEDKIEATKAAAKAARQRLGW